MALGVTLAAFINLLNAFGWSQDMLLEDVVNLHEFGWGRDSTIIGALLLLVIARALVRGKRQAWWITLGLLGIAMLSAFLEQRRWGEALFPLALLTILLASSPLYTTRSNHRALARGYVALAGGVIIIAGFGSIAHLIAWQIGRVHLNGVFPLLRLLAFGFLSFGIWSVLRPAMMARFQQQEVSEVQRLLPLFGTLATAHFVLTPDKRYFWDTRHQSCLVYRVEQGIAIVLGDPLGTPEHDCDLIEMFLAFCRLQDWQPVWYQSSQRLNWPIEQRHFVRYTIGAEAIVDLAQFTLAGKVGAPVRHAIARVQRDHVVISQWQVSVTSNPRARKLRLTKSRKGASSSATRIRWGFVVITLSLRSEARRLPLR